MGTNNDTTLHQLAYVLNKNCSANDLQIYTNGSNEESVGLFHFAHACFLLAYLAPNTKYGHVALHCGLVVGFLILSIWAWNIVCAPDVFAWYLAFTALNIGQLLYILYTMRPIRFDEDLEAIYAELFAPMCITRQQFQKLCSVKVLGTYPKVLNFHSGECYSIQDMTKTDRLALCLRGRINVLTDKSFLHSIHPGEFLDSPEFESSKSSGRVDISESTFKVTICAAVSTRCLIWPRVVLDFLFIKDPHLAKVMSTLISRDITHKLMCMNSKLKTKDGNPMDLRLPGIAGRLKEMDARELASFTALASNNEEKSRRQATERQKNSGKRKRDLLPDNPMIKKNFGESRVSDLDKALEIDLNL